MKKEKNGWLKTKNGYILMNKKPKFKLSILDIQIIIMVIFIIVLFIMK